MNQIQASKLFNALSDPSRVSIVKELYHNETFYVGQLLEMVKIGQSTLSYHLSLLYESGLLSYKKVGKKVYYYCNRDLVDSLFNYISKKN